MSEIPYSGEWNAGAGKRPPLNDHPNRTALIIWAVVFTVAVTGIILFLVMGSSAGAAGDCGGG